MFKENSLCRANHVAIVRDGASTAIRVCCSLGRDTIRTCVEYRGHGVDADLRGARADDDDTGPCTFLWGHGPQDECAGDSNAEFCGDLPRHRTMDDHRL